MIHAVIPVKQLNAAKSRLAQVLSASERRQLALIMLGDVLAAVTAAPSVSSVTVVSRDPAALALAAEFGASVLLDHGVDLNEALDQAAAHVVAQAPPHAIPALLVLPSDLPLLNAQEIELLVEALGPLPAAVAAPALDGGTNALLLAPPTAMPFLFGPGSLARHIAAAHGHGVSMHLVRARGLEIDVDRPADLLRLRMMEGTTAAQRLLRALDLEARAVCA